MSMQIRLKNYPRHLFHRRLHFVVRFRNMDTSAGRSTEARGLPHAFPTYDPIGIRWHDFVRNTEVVDRTNLPCVQDIIAKRRNSLFGHVVRLDDHTPAHRALSQVTAARTGPRFGPAWLAATARTPAPFMDPADRRWYTLQHSCRMVKARRRGRSGLTHRTSAVYAI